MAIPEYKNAKYISETVTVDGETKRIIDVEINHHAHGWIGYTCNPLDIEQVEVNQFSNIELYNTLNADSNTIAYVPPTDAEVLTEAQANVRGERNYLLETVVDPIVSNSLRWSSMSDAHKTAYENYRTALLGVPQQSGFPNDVTFPTLTLE